MKLKCLLFFVASAISLHSFAGEYNFDGTDYDRNIKTLDWSEEFDVDGRPNPEKWDYEVGYVRNKEAQYYTKDDPKNTRVENGMLVIEAVKDESSPNKITSASVITLNKKDFYTADRSPRKNSRRARNMACHMAAWRQPVQAWVAEVRGNRHYGRSRF